MILLPRLIAELHATLTSGRLKKLGTSALPCCPYHLYFFFVCQPDFICPPYFCRYEVLKSQTSIPSAEQLSAWKADPTFTRAVGEAYCSDIESSFSGDAKVSLLSPPGFCWREALT